MVKKETRRANERKKERTSCVGKSRLDCAAEKRKAQKILSLLRISGLCWSPLLLLLVDDFS